MTTAREIFRFIRSPFAAARRTWNKSLSSGMYESYYSLPLLQKKQAQSYGHFAGVWG